ncbi:MAG: M50 family metallopeptidase [Gemmatimonadota bacterium]
MPSRSKKNPLVFLTGFALYFGALWFLWNTPVVYPLKLFVIFLHEISHGIAAVATGGSIQEITINPRLGGACYCPGGNAFLTLSAGYLGSLVWGGVILEAGWRARSRVHLVVRIAGAMMLLLTLLFVRGIFGFVFGAAFGIALILTARHLSLPTNRRVLEVLGLTSCLYAVLDIKSDVLDRPELPSDAAMLGELTGVPTLVWGALWITMALGISAWLFRRAYRHY